MISQSGVGFLAIIVTYKNEIPDEEIRRQEGEDLLQALNIDIMDEYTKQTDIANGDRAVYTYYLQQDGIKLSPEGYSIGGEGDGTEYYGQLAKISMEDTGYTMLIQKPQRLLSVKVFQRGSGFQMRMHYRRYMMLYGMGYRFRHWKQIQLRILQVEIHIFQ